MKSQKAGLFEVALTGKTWNRFFPKAFPVIKHDTVGFTMMKRMVHMLVCDFLFVKFVKAFYSHFFHVSAIWLA